MSVPSTADRFIELMAAIKSLDAGNEEPMRHAVRRLRNNATGILEAAITEAWVMVDVARQIPGDCAEAIADAKKEGAA